MNHQAQVTVDEFRTNLADYIGRVMYGKERIVVTKYNREAAIIISPEEYIRFTNPLKRFSKKEWAAKFKVFDKIKEKNKDKDPALVKAEIARAIKDVRTQRK
jgi:prevent-host-death family protein